MRTFSTPIRRVLILTLMLTLVAMTGSFATNYYSRTNGGSWGTSTTWSTVTYGNPTNTGTFPKAGDNVFIGDHYHIFIDMNAFCANVTVGQGSTGILEISDASTYVITISGNVSINHGGSFIYNGTKSRTQTLFIGINLVNNGTFDLYSSATDVVNLIFNTKFNSVISGSGVFDFNNVTLVKSLSTAVYMDVQVNSFENAIRKLIISYGTYIHNNSGIYNVNPTLVFTLTTNGIVQVPQGEMDFSSTTDYMYLEGIINVNGGIVRVGSTLGNKGLRYAKNGVVIPTVNVSSGNLIVYGGITYETGFSNSPFIFSQSNGTVLLNSGTNGTNTEVFKVTDVATSSFTMSNGVMILEKPSLGGSTFADFGICGSAGVVNSTAGVIQFGDASTLSGKVFNFVPFPNVIQPSFQITGPPANVITLKTSTSSTVNFQLLSLYIDVNKVFDIRSVSGTAGDTKQMTLTQDYDGINALVNNGTFVARQSTVILKALEGQWIGGTTATDFYNLTINNAFGISLGVNANVTHLLNLTNGIIYTSSTAMITCTSTGSSNIGSSTSYVDGPMTQIISSVALKNVNLPVGKNGDYRPMVLNIQHNNLTAITYTAEVWNSSARAMGYTLPPTLTWVSDIRYYTIDRTPVANVNKAKLTLTYGADDIVTDYSNLRVANYNGSGAWIDNNGVGTANNAGSITSTNFTSFNRKFALGNGTGGTNPLPVELVSFTAQKSNANVDLKWTTASEKNSDYFSVERSNDGSHFTEMGKVKSAGNSTEVLNYNYTDYTPSKGNNYYRLKQVDIDGATTYSAIRAITASPIGHVSTYPNPAITSDNLSVVVPENLVGKWTIHIVDISGRIVAEQTGDSADANTIQLSLGNTIAAGSYILQLNDESNNIWQEHLILNP